MIKRPDRTALGTMNKSGATLPMQSRVPYWAVSSKPDLLCRRCLRRFAPVTLISAIPWGVIRDLCTQGLRRRRPASPESVWQAIEKRGVEGDKGSNNNNPVANHPSQNTISIISPAGLLLSVQ